MKNTTHTIRKLKGERPVVCVTAYDAITTRFASAAGVDIILVGDSLGNTILGYDNTVPVTLDDMCHHSAAVARTKPDALVAVDVPFAEAHYGFDRVLAGCQRLVQEGGAEAVKIEGGASMAPTIARLVDAGIAVWGHIGLKPQQVHALGRYRKFGTNAAEAESLIADAIALEKAGIFALLIEMVDANLARKLTETVKVPVVGIGSGPHCDGQILVYADMLGLSGGYVPGFVRQFADAGEQFKKGFAAYADAVKKRKFPEV